jgi:hypothetical protein
VDQKRLITSFFLANAVDATITSMLLTQQGWQELNRLAFDSIAQDGIQEVLILKLALTAVLIGSYALAHCISSRLEYPLEKALQWGAILVWGVQVWNAANVIAELFLRVV